MLKRPKKVSVKKVRVWIGLSILMLFLLFFYLVRVESFFLSPLITGVSTPPDYGDFIVVFGGGMIRDRGVQIGRSTRERLDLAVTLYKTRRRPILVSDGSLYRKSPAIPLILTYMQRRGVLPEDIMVDGASQTTADNVMNSLVIAREKGLNAMLVCTSPYHQKRSQLLLEKAQAKGFKMAVMSRSEIFSADTLGQRMRNINLISHEYAALLILYVRNIF
jgi:uncharacterized SAM-binding protein YcdF (DUF218 family)